MSRESILGQRRKPVRGSSTRAELDPERFRFPIHARVPFTLARALQRQAKDRGITFSERIRQALSDAVRGGPGPLRSDDESCSRWGDRPPSPPSATGAEVPPQAEP